jgi:hypothetical protein
VLPQGYRDLLEVAEDAGRPLWADGKTEVMAGSFFPRFAGACQTNRTGGRALVEPYAIGDASPFAASADLFTILVEELQYLLRSLLPATYPPRPFR